MDAGIHSIDCDIHPSIPGTKALMPYLEEHWRDHLSFRGIDDVELTYNAYRNPFSCRPDWRPPTGKPGGDPSQVLEQALDAFGASIGILNPLWGGPVVYADDMAFALCHAANDWIAATWLDRDPRLRASMLVPFESPELAAEEIEHRARDRRFVQVLLLAMTEAPLGRRHYWPIYRAAARAGLPIAIHAGTGYRNPPTGIGWPSTYVEDYAAQTGGFQTQVLSLMTEGVLTKFPELKVVLVESGVAWLTSFLWRLNKTWRGVRIEVPWIKEAPAEILRRSLRMTIQPLNAPKGEEQVRRMLDHIGGDHMLLFSTDYPHWHFDGGDAMPPGLPAALHRKIRLDNPLETYSRLMETLQ
ncbi:amidohydrolase family protein [Ancylobacter mangrovi]|uniref:amidohydrolase family protein n=1 Tax=Ancylobacter mangrovi TaxID=2972472 RepID=UPI002161F727|nr:amidohydrolase family protein [Ancylobacter mangrovi]MCS0502045.1 amidohydrolase [Ancylobacter mangrovi]